MLRTRIYRNNEWTVIRARTVENLLRRVARLYGGSHCYGRVNGWAENEDAAEHQVTICRAPRRRRRGDGATSVVVREMSVWIERCA